jgi:hypothetical protein
MMDHVALFVAASALAMAMVMGSMTIGARAWVHRACVIAAFLALMPVAFLGFHNLTGRPRPVDAITLMGMDGEAMVSGFYAIRPVGIYIMVELEVGGPHTYLQLPWDEELFDELTRQDQEAKAMGTQLMMKLDMLRKRQKDMGRGEGEEHAQPRGDDGDGDRAQRGGRGDAQEAPGVFHPRPPRELPPKTYQPPHADTI